MQLAQPVRPFFVPRVTAMVPCRAESKAGFRLRQNPMKNTAMPRVAACAIALAAGQLTATADLSADFVGQFAGSDAPNIFAKVKTGKPDSPAKVLEKGEFHGQHHLHLHDPSRQKRILRSGTRHRPSRSARGYRSHGPDRLRQGGHWSKGSSWSHRSH